MKQILALVRRLIGRAAKWFLLRVALPCAYRISARKPLQADKAVFVTVRKTVFSDSLQLLYRQCISEEKQVSTHILAYSSSRYPALLYKGLRLMRDIADAKCVFLDDSCEAMGCFRRRKGQQIVQVWHACGAFKKFGWSTARLGFGQSVEEMTSYPSHRNYTLVPVSGPQVVENYREAFAADAGVVRALGVSRTDVFFEPDFVPNSRAVVEEVIPAARGKKILLYAPTFRDDYSMDAYRLDFAGILEAMERRFRQKMVLVVRLHPNVQDQADFIEYDDRILNGTTWPDAQELYMAADYMISDYSSSFLDYALLNRPVFLCLPDYEKYRAERGLNEVFEQCPFPRAYSSEQLLEVIGTFSEEKYWADMAAFREKWQPYDDGHAAQTIVAWMKQKMQEG